MIYAISFFLQESLEHNLGVGILVHAASSEALFFYKFVFQTVLEGFRPLEGVRKESVYFSSCKFFDLIFGFLD